MSPLSHGRKPLESLALTEGFERETVHDSLGRFLRRRDAAGRRAAFCLVEVRGRRLYQRYDAGSVIDCARAPFELGDWRTREVPAIAGRLRDLPCLDQASKAGGVAVRAS